MNVLNTLHQRGGVSRKEALAIITLSATFLVGMGIRWWQSEQQRQKPIPSFDYSRTDSIYAAHVRSAKTAKTTRAAQTAPAKQTKQHPPVSSINLNQATKAQLMNLPGIGPAYAERIIAYREQHGGFGSVDELLLIKGIGKKKLEKIRAFVYVR